MRLSTLLVVVITTSVALAAPSRRNLNKKFTRQTEEQAAPVVVPAGAAQQQSPDVTWKPETSSTTVVTIQKVPVIEAETGSVAPLGEVIENKPPVVTTVKTVVEGESLSTPAPEDNKNEPPPPKVQLPTVNLAVQPAPPVRPASIRPPLPPNGPPPTLPPPPQKPTKKPGDEDDSSSEEDGEEAAEGGDNEEPSAEDETNEDEDEEEDEEARKLSRTAMNKRVGRQESAELIALDGDYGRNLDAFIPGYISEEGEVFVPIDTVDQGVPYTIIPDRASTQGRVGILLRAEADEDDGDDNDATTSEEEDDDATPVRISSFQVIYKDKKKNKNKEKEGDDDDDDDADDDDSEAEDEEGTGEGGPDSVEEKEGSEENRPPPPPEPPIIPEKPPKLALVKPGSDKPGRPSVDTPVKLDPLRPPPLAYVPATLPTKEDDEDEFRRYRAGLAGPPSYPPYPYAYHPSYYYFNEPPALRDGHYFDTVRVLRRRNFA